LLPQVIVWYYYTAAIRYAGDNNYDDNNESDPSGGVDDMLGMASQAGTNWGSTSMH